MIPRITQQGPNILERYWCGNCSASLPRPYPVNGELDKSVWKFCPHCGKPIEYDKAKPVQWAEQNCERCGSWLIMKSGSGSSTHFMASSDYVGASICRPCMEEHCAQTNCLQCELGQQPGCRYDWIKRCALKRNDNT